MKRLIPLFAAAAFSLNAYADLSKSPAYFKEPAPKEELAKVHTELGSLYFAKGSLAVALDELNRALYFDSSYSDALSTRALVYNQMREYDKADADFKAALKSGEKNPALMNNYGWYLCDRGQSQKGLEYTVKAAMDPLYATPAVAYMNAGYCAMKMGDAQQASMYLKQSMSISDSPQAHFYMAQLLEKRKAYPEAYEELKIALRGMEPPTAEVLMTGIRLGREMNDDVAVRSYARQLKTRFPLSKEWEDAMALGY